MLNMDSHGASARVWEKEALDLGCAWDSLLVAVATLVCGWSRQQIATFDLAAFFFGHLYSIGENV